MSKVPETARIASLEARVRELEEQLATERARSGGLSEREEKLRLASSAMGLGLWYWDLIRDELTWDANMCELHGGGPPDVPTRYIEEFVHPEDRERVRRDSVGASEAGKKPPQVMHRVVRRDDGRVVWVLTTGRLHVDAEGKPVYAVGGSIDATRQYELEVQLRLSQQAQAVGSLTAGVAHNFNNMLAVILPTLELAAELVPPERADLLKQALQAAGRASELVRQLMTYAGQNRAAYQHRCRVANVVDGAVVRMRQTLEPHIAIQVEFDPGVTELEVEGNSVQLEYVLVQLLLNARDAVIEADRAQGIISVRVRRARSLLSTKVRPEPHSALSIDVRDNGTGIEPASRAHLFEPFFTTKTRSTGLGLATSFGTVRDHGGTLECPEVAGEGALFTLTLPLPDMAPLLPDVAPPSSDDVPPGTRVLLIDDDASVRGALGYVLHSLGLTVFEASGGPMALGALRAHPDVDVVLLDNAVSVDATDRFLARLREVAPGARFILFSGDAVAGDGQRLADAVVSKPVSSPLLLKTIRSVLDDPKP